MSTIGDDLLRAASPEFGPKLSTLIVYNANPVAVAPESAKVMRGFAREDLFTVVLEHFKTDTADYADILLPATTQLEHVDVHATYGHLYIVANNAAIKPLGEAKPNSEIFRLLAAKLPLDTIGKRSNKPAGLSCECLLRHSPKAASQRRLANASFIAKE
jgi:anaerobic selenocysteine-containing dehydrogenase